MERSPKVDNNSLFLNRINQVRNQLKKKTCPMQKKNPVRVLITGASGKTGYALSL